VHVVETLSSPAVSVKPSSAFITGSNSAVAVSAASTVEQPFHTADHWKVTGSFTFGTLTSQPFSSTVTLGGQQPTESGCRAADVAVTGQSTVLASTQNTDVTLASVPLSVISQRAQQTVMSPAADAGSHQLHDVVNGSLVPSSADCVPSSVALGGVECDSSKTSSRAVITTTTSSYIAAAAAERVDSLPLTTLQSSSLFSFGQAAFTSHSGKPLGVPATSALQSNATTGFFVTWLLICFTSICICSR